MEDYSLHDYRKLLGLKISLYLIDIYIYHSNDDHDDNDDYDDDDGNGDRNNVDGVGDVTKMSIANKRQFILPLHFGELILMASY